MGGSKWGQCLALLLLTPAGLSLASLGGRALLRSARCCCSGCLGGRLLRLSAQRLCLLRMHLLQAVAQRRAVVGDGHRALRRYLRVLVLWQRASWT